MKILLVEDEIELSKALKVILTKNNYAVDCAFDGEEGKEYIDRYKYDAIILDIMMPKKDGITLLKEIRSEGNNTPVIILSAKAQVRDRVLGLNCGADDYLPKPFSIDELLARLNSITRRVSDIIVSSMKVGNTSLDRNVCSISTEFGTTTLLRKEFQILEYLMRNYGSIVSAEKIISNVWDEDSFSINNNLWVFLSYLRRKMKEVKSNLVIKNSRNVGYYLEVKNEKN